MNKTIIAFLLVVIIAVAPMLLIGCQIGKGKTDVPSTPDDSNVTDNGDGQDGQQLAEFAQLLDGFKVVYSKGLSGSTNPIQPLADQLTTGILDQLNSFYGSGTDNDALATYFPDSIRQTIYQDTDGIAQLADDTSIVNDQWLWTLNPKAERNFNDIFDTIFQGQDYTAALANCQNTLNSDEKTYPQLYSVYSIPLQIALYEILLGYSQNNNCTMYDKEFVDQYEYRIPDSSFSICDEYYSKFAIKIKNSINTNIVDKYIYYYESEIKIKYSVDGQYTEINIPSINLDCDSLISDYLKYLEDTYQSTATYSGLTKTDADAYITYLLDNVIGAQVVANDYRQFGPNQTTYRDSISLAKYQTDGELDLAKLNYTDGTYNYYNYRNYVGRVAEMVYSLVYDGAEQFVYTYQGDGFEIEYDYVQSYQDQHGAMPDEQDSIMRAKSASFIGDYDNEQFFSFDDTPLAEYQSVTLMPQQDIAVSTLKLQVFTANPDLSVGVNLRYYAYDPITGEGKLHVFAQDDINFYQATPYDSAYSGRDCQYHRYVAGKGYLYKTTQKDNDGHSIQGYYTTLTVRLDLSAISADFIVKDDSQDNAKPDGAKVDQFVNSKFDPKLQIGSVLGGHVEAPLNDAFCYKVIPSAKRGGFTVLDERQIQFSFFEMTFDIHKDLSNQNYDFKFCIVEAQ
ncbi:MAG: hypothetical protein ACI4MY_03185 [Christensenellales bacterium]